jgi:chemotaxis protein MotA
MLAIVGLVIVIGAVLGGFTIAGGHIPALFHVSEFIVIGGTAVGTVLIANPSATVKALAGKLGGVLKASPYTKAFFLDALKLQYELFQLARKDGLVALEGHIEDPEKSAVFRRYPQLLHEHHAVEFFCDSLRLVLLGSVPPYDLEALMDSDIDVHHEDEAKPVGLLARTADALPGIGIVAAVLGIVVTMGAIAGPVEEIGEKVAAALTGTFLGVLAAYGFASPIATAIENRNAAATVLYRLIKAGTVAFAKGLSPMVATEFARRAISAEARPSFEEVEAACKALKQKG